MTESEESVRHEPLSVRIRNWALAVGAVVAAIFAILSLGDYKSPKELWVDLKPKLGFDGSTELRQQPAQKSPTESRPGPGEGRINLGSISEEQPAVPGASKKDTRRSDHAETAPDPPGLDGVQLKNNSVDLSSNRSQPRSPMSDIELTERFKNTVWRVFHSPPWNQRIDHIALTDGYNQALQSTNGESADFADFELSTPGTKWSVLDGQLVLEWSSSSATRIPLSGNISLEYQGTATDKKEGQFNVPVMLTFIGKWDFNNDQIRTGNKERQMFLEADK